MKIKATKQLIHEFNQHGQHRIVILSSDGTNEASEWFGVEQIIHFCGVYATADTSSGLPPHIFRAASVPCQVVA